MQRKFILILSAVLCLGLQSAFAQANNEMENAEKYFAEAEKCLNLTNEQKFQDAEKSCRSALAFAEKLPAGRELERYSAYRGVGVVLLYQKRAEESIAFFNKSLKAAGNKVNESDTKTGTIYFYIGQANYLLGKVKEASDFYTKAEKIYREAFDETNINEISAEYPKKVKLILQAQLILLENAKLTEEAKAVKMRLEKFEKEFSKYL
jgi:tetratricopeptide (TPR) repeat protein